MIYWLFQDYFFKANLLLRMSGAAVLSFLIVMIAGPRMIRFLVHQKLGDNPEFNRADLNELTRHKGAVPTMGGILIVLAIFAAVVLWANLGNFYIRMGLFALVWLGVLGAWDDWLKLRYAAKRGQRDGLKSWEKLLFQIALAVMLSVFMSSYGKNLATTKQFYLPFWSEAIGITLGVHILITVATMVGASNAVNLTDGMDGLASGCMLVVIAFFLLISWSVGVETWAKVLSLPVVHGAAEMTVLCSAILGACLGFLWYNAAPAAVFMGDTGSLPLGGVLGYIAVVTRQEVLLLIAGGVFVLEAISVILQVGWFKWTKRRNGGQGRRLFACAPIHWHFHLKGWAETKVVIRFWVLSLLFAALALASLKLK